MGGFVSTSLDKQTAESFANSDNSNQENVIIEIKTEKNSSQKRKFAKIANDLGEEEVLFSPFCWFEVASTKSKYQYKSDPIRDEQLKVIREGYDIEIPKI